MFSRPFFATTTPARRMITSVALVAYLLTVVGYPLPLSAKVERDSSEAFPCQAHACGCRTAAQCWENCCCHTAAERLAWARQHDATLPKGTLANLEKEAAQQASAERCDQRGGCCASAGNEDDHEHAGGFVWVNAIQAQKCQGLTTLWVACGANLPLEISTLWEFDWQLLEHLLLDDEHSLCESQRPPVPPPWPCA